MIVVQDSQVVDTEQVAVRLAAALLLSNGEVSYSEISSMPFVQSHEEVVEVMATLLDRFDAELANKVVPKQLVSVSEAVVRLRS